MILWRIATETRKYPADDMSGGGAALYPGRWNEERQPVVYATLAVSLAVLETAAHIADAGLPLNRFLIRIDVPTRVWNAREQIDAGSLPATWAAIPAGKASARFGADWIRSGRSAILLVPSVIVPEEWVALVNPAHGDAVKLKAQVVRAFEYNRLFRGR
jgi:RES domain-containing protein